MQPHQARKAEKNWRGFIAAPLLGTLIFLAAIIFVAHVNQVDKVETATIVSETYHNRIVNILEDYRADLGVLFAVNVVRAIQKHLTSECWNLFRLSNNRPDPTIPTGETNPGTRNIPPVPFNKFLTKFNYDNLPFCKGAAGQLNSPPPAGDPPNGCGTRGVTATNPNDPNSFLCSENCNQQLDYYELRYQKCAQVSEIIKDGICPYDEKYGITAWIDSTRGTRIPNHPNSPRVPYFFEGINLSLSNDAQVASTFISRYGCVFAKTLGDDKTYLMPIGSGSNMVLDKRTDSSLPDGACRGSNGPSNDRNNIEYGNRCVCSRASGCRVQTGTDPKSGYLQFDQPVGEGVALDCAGADKKGYITTGDGINNCRQLIGDSLFDCRNFAVPENPEGNPFRCCDKFYYNPQAASDPNNGRCCSGNLIGSEGCRLPNNQPDPQNHEIEGCEQGSFFVKVNILASNAIYLGVPRVRAQDKAGNTIQGGALGQQDFVVHVKYPVYKYLDAAFKFYAPLAYGASGLTRTVTNDEGETQTISIDFDDPAENSKKHAGKGRIPRNYLPPGELIETYETETRGKETDTTGRIAPNRRTTTSETETPGKETDTTGRIAPNQIVPNQRTGTDEAETNQGDTLNIRTQQAFSAVRLDDIANSLLGSGSYFEERTNPAGANDQKESEGVIEGVCYGKKCQCDGNPLNPGACLVSYRQLPSQTTFAAKTPSPAQNDPALLKQESSRNYYDTFLNPYSSKSVCRLVNKKASGGICEAWGTCKMQIWLRGYSLAQQDASEFVMLCRGEDSPQLYTDTAGKCRATSGAPGSECQQDERIQTAFYHPLNPINLMAVQQCTVKQEDGICAYIDSLYLTLDFRDFDEKSLVLPDAPEGTKQESPLPHNRFCWYATPSHYNP